MSEPLIKPETDELDNTFNRMLKKDHIDKHRFANLILSVSDNLHSSVYTVLK